MSEAVREAYLDACELELQAFKPGNVSVHSEGHDMTVADFRRSAEVSAPFLADSTLSLGEKIYFAIEATRTAVGCNTNLGIVLLAAPLLRAVETRVSGESLRDALRRILDTTTVADAEWVYRAIRVAQPGGLGAVPEQDVHAAPKVALREAMNLAQHRDRIAYQYSNYYADIFELAIPRYDAALSRWDNEAWAAVAVFVELLMRIPDSHVERKFGTRFTRMVADRMARLHTQLSGSDEPEQAMWLLNEVDAEFKACGINPGTTADLTVTCVLAARLQALLHQ